MCSRNNEKMPTVTHRNVNRCLKLRLSPPNQNLLILCQEARVSVHLYWTFWPQGRAIRVEFIYNNAARTFLARFYPELKWGTVEHRCNHHTISAAGGTHWCIYWVWIILLRNGFTFDHSIELDLLVVAGSRRSG